jgi:osmoprotectant transport system ATP-binding protein
VISAERNDALRLENVVKRYGAVEALGGVSLCVRSGEAVALVGESGSGKTTLLRLFNRMLSPDAGRVLVRGRDVAVVDAVLLRREIGYVQQEGGLLPHWTVRRNAGMVPWLRGASMQESGRQADAALALVGLEPERFGERWPRELSGGQRQRVAVARALAARPATILLDEPFGALDAITRADLQEMLVALRVRLELTLVLVTHDLHEAIRLADRIAVLRQGRLEQIATPADLLRAPASEYVERLLERSQVRGP